MLEGPSLRRQSSGSGRRLGLSRSTSVLSGRAAPMQLEQLLTGKSEGTNGRGIWALLAAPCNVRSAISESSMRASELHTRYKIRGCFLTIDTHTEVLTLRRSMFEAVGRLSTANKMVSSLFNAVIMPSRPPEWTPLNTCLHPPEFWDRPQLLCAWNTDVQNPALWHLVLTAMLHKQVMHCGAGAYTAKRYALWQSRQAVLNAQLTGPTGASHSQLDTETAAADAIAALGEFQHQYA